MKLNKFGPMYEITVQKMCYPIKVVNYRMIFIDTVR